MGRFASRQIHLDFHTSEFIPGVGSRFNAEQFQAALQIGHVDSITLFAKCHHSWSYYPTKAGQMHPSLNFDLTSAMIAAAHTIGVKAPVYITVGWSSNDANTFPECIERKKDGSIRMFSGKEDGLPDEKLPIISWKYMCPSGRYAELIYKQTQEICQMYADLDGLFYDICFHNICWCGGCKKDMQELGLDPENDADANRYNSLKWSVFTTKCKAILFEHHPAATIFFNGGAELDKKEWNGIHTHIEMEDLPTTWGGYDKLPVRAKYFANFNIPYLGMTGKFHTMWGEFGGFKTADALRYEIAAMMVYSARCSIGDQMHPCGELDLEAYRIIGVAYDYAERIEMYCLDVKDTTRLGIILADDMASNEGLAKILLDCQLDFGVAFFENGLAKWDVLILPDSVLLSDEQALQINDYLDNGGKVLLTGTSGLDHGKTHFQVNPGASYVGPSLFESDYVQVSTELSSKIVSSPFLFYSGAEQVKVSDGTILADIREPYFNRTYGHYCSHQNTPYRMEKADYPAAVQRDNVIYLAHEICKMYLEHGAQFHRDYFNNALKLLYTNPVLTVDMPSSGRVRLVHQPEQGRYILHLLYATPIQRGRTSVIEDLPKLLDVNVAARIREKVAEIILPLTGEMLLFTQLEDRVSFSVPVVQCHQIVCLNY